MSSGEDLKLLRARCGVTPDWLAAEAGVSLRSLQRWEAQSKDPCDAPGVVWAVLRGVKVTQYEAALAFLRGDVKAIRRFTEECKDWPARMWTPVDTLVQLFSDVDLDVVKLHQAALNRNFEAGDYLDD